MTAGKLHLRFLHLVFNVLLIAFTFAACGKRNIDWDRRNERRRDKSEKIANAGRYAIDFERLDSGQIGKNLIFKLNLFGSGRTDESHELIFVVKEDGRLLDLITKREIGSASCQTPAPEQAPTNSPTTVISTPSSTSHPMAECKDLTGTVRLGSDEKEPKLSIRIQRLQQIKMLGHFPGGTPALWGVGALEVYSVQLPDQSFQRQRYWLEPSGQLAADGIPLKPQAFRLDYRQNENSIQAVDAVVPLPAKSNSGLGVQFYGPLTAYTPSTDGTRIELGLRYIVPESESSDTVSVTLEIGQKD